MDKSNSKSSEGASHAFIPGQLRDYGLPAEGFRIYCEIASRSEWRAGKWIGRHWATTENTAKSCRLHRSTVREWIKTLVSLRLIDRNCRPGDTTEYWPTPIHEWVPSPFTKDNPGLQTVGVADEDSKAEPAEMPCLQTSSPTVSRQPTPTVSRQPHPYGLEAAKGSPIEGEPRRLSQKDSEHLKNLKRNGAVSGRGGFPAITDYDLQHVPSFVGPANGNRHFQAWCQALEAKHGGWLGTGDDETWAESYGGWWWTRWLQSPALFKRVWNDALEMERRHCITDSISGAAYDLWKNERLGS